MKIGVLKETNKNDKRVAISPSITKKLIEMGFECLVQENAGLLSSFKNSDYSQSGAIISSKNDIYKILCSSLLSISLQ